MKQTTDAMHRGLRKAVVDLRERMRWGQEDLANEITKVAAKMKIPISPNRRCVIRWEAGEAAPDPQHRAVLARIAARDPRTEDLAELFRAPLAHWRLAAYVQLDSKDDK
ncbi:MAG TPA: hypothetical protein VF501_00505 [Thiobacillus sp.]